MNFKYLVLAAALAPAAASAQQTALTTATYTQNFDTLASTGTTGTVLPAGFNFVESGDGANAIYSVGNGSSNSGDSYSFGATGSSERAFGSLGSGNVGPVTFGFLFTNGLGSTITGFDFGYTGEQWRLGNSTVDGLVFEYSTNATNLTNGSWATLGALNFAPAVVSGTQGGLNGNLPANQRNLFAAINNVSIAAGGSFAFRWTDQNSTGNDHGLAIDNVSITSRLAAGAVPEPATWAMMMLGFGAMGFAMRRRPTAGARIRFA